MIQGFDAIQLAKVVTVDTNEHSYTTIKEDIMLSEYFLPEGISLQSQFIPPEQRGAEES